MCSHRHVTASSWLLCMMSLPASVAFYLPDSNPLLAFGDQVREVHLYTENHRRALFLQMMDDGRVPGSEVQNPNTVMQLKSVRPGHVAVQGRASSLFLCLDRTGSLSGRGVFSEVDCSFQELLLADGYTRFLSAHHGFPLSLAPKRSAAQHSVPFTRFLLLRDSPAQGSEPGPEPGAGAGPNAQINTDSHDLFGMGLTSVVSPQFTPHRR